MCRILVRGNLRHDVPFGEKRVRDTPADSS